MYRITKQFTFSASHQLSGLPSDHPCSRLHGHNYVVEIELSGMLNEVGFVQDYRDLDFVKDLIDRDLDHQHLNDAVGFNPTAENLARWIFWLCFERFNKLTAVRVSETPRTWAEYRRETALPVPQAPPAPAPTTSQLAEKIAELLKDLERKGELI